MNREAYELANRIETELDAEKDYLTDCPGDVKMKRYKNTVLQEIKKEKQAKKSTFRGVSVAACAALMLLMSMVMFGEEVHAMIKQVSWGIGNALGISSDLADYREVVNTSVTNKGYIVTLQEAVATEEKLLISYTVQREDGGSLEEMITPEKGVNLDKWIYPSTGLYINGKKEAGAVTTDYVFINEEQTVIGGEAEFHLHDMDLSQESEYEISFYQDKWNVARKVAEFAFKADGTDLIADTRRVAIDREFELPDGVKVTLKEFTSNDLEQRISYEFSGDTEYILRVEAVDSEGKHVQFGTRTQGNGSGYMQNRESIADEELYARVDENTEVVEMKLFAVELPKESGKMSNDYVQIGESFEVELQ